MPLRFVCDEHLRGRLPLAVERHNQASPHAIDLVAVGDPSDLPLGTRDPDLLQWAERAGRILITRDVSTMPGHLAAHLLAGRRSPGVMALRRGVSIPEFIAYLEFAAHAGEPADFADRATFVP